MLRLTAVEKGRKGVDAESEREEENQFSVEIGDEKLCCHLNGAREGEVGPGGY